MTPINSNSDNGLLELNAKVSDDACGGCNAGSIHTAAGVKLIDVVNHYIVNNMPAAIKAGDISYIKPLLEHHEGSYYNGDLQYFIKIAEDNKRNHIVDFLQSKIAVVVPTSLDYSPTDEELFCVFGDLTTLQQLIEARDEEELYHAVTAAEDCGYPRLADYIQGLVDQFDNNNSQ